MGSGHGKLETVRLTVLGCSGSVVGPASPASGYLVTAPDTAPAVIDFGGCVLVTLQRYADPNSVNVLLSHLHADHCLDLPGLFVWRRYHPRPATERGLMYGPANTWARLGAASSPEAGDIDDFSDIFDVRHWEDGRAAAAAGGGELLLTHIPPWTSREDVISEAKAEFDGPVHAVVCGEAFDVSR